MNRLNVLLNPNAIQIGFSGCDVADLCMVLDWGRLDISNNSYDPNRNYYMSHWDEYKSKRERYEIISEAYTIFTFL